MPEKSKKDIAEMFGEFFRDAAVLVTVFLPLEFAIKGNGNISFFSLAIFLCLALLLLGMGIICEKARG